MKNEMVTNTDSFLPENTETIEQITKLFQELLSLVYSPEDFTLLALPKTGAIKFTVGNELQSSRMLRILKRQRPFEAEPVISSKSGKVAYYLQNKDWPWQKPKNSKTAALRPSDHW